MIEKGKKYTVAELRVMLGRDWQEKAGIKILRVVQNKPIINSFDEFDDQTKEIYAKVKEMVVAKNKGEDVNVWATGSRVKGTWRTKDETEAGEVKKYSDYDYCTDAKNKPSREDFTAALNEPIDHSGCEGHKILIT